MASDTARVRGSHVHADNLEALEHGHARFPSRQNSSPESFFIAEANDIVESPEEAPLLPLKEEEGARPGGTASLESSVFNLSNTMIGAGLMALPAAMKMLGLVPGTLAMVLISFLSYASIMAMLRCTAAVGVDSYSKVVAQALGWWGKLVLNLSIVVNNWGLLMVLLIIIGDVLCGTALHPGLLPEWFGSCWMLSDRRVVLAVVILLMCPLVLLEKLDSLRFASRLSVALSLVFVVTTVGLALLKIAEGKAEMPSLMGGSSASWLGIFSVLNVVNNAFICQFNIMPIYRELREPSLGSMKAVVRWSLGSTTLVYVLVGIFGVVLFGAGTQNDVLQNFDSSLAAITAHAYLWAAVVKLGYALSRALTVPLILFTLRILLNRGLAKAGALPKDAAARARFYAITALILLGTYVGAVEVPDIWVIFQFMGATAAVLIGFILPGLVALHLEGGATTARERWEARVLVGAGCLIGCIGIVNNIYTLFVGGGAKGALTAGGASQHLDAGAALHWVSSLSGRLFSQ
eukprot:jgi/Mesen1/2963/ME000176S02003